ncbi:cytochrome c oxidase assembly protein [Actinomadura sp. 7K534]|uniref:cytochrome c oxidase assembly protein n=1 Tax=Actinomadura sp. 7K534 TaxID=2530366 RepID=UPI00104BBED6|nr:cytochrome c oxidase assembly protein [Actinomadura sp. 7K534]TDB85648.1 cytochrome c oxidase assembly protein [Actinomadura sp. 7K534]
MHNGHGPGLEAGQIVAVACALPVVAGYLAAARRLRGRGDAWPWGRDACFAAGGAALAAAVAGPLPGGAFTVHMAQHLLAGMVAPVLLVLARPLTLALRALRPGGPRRALLAAAHWRVSGWLLFPPVAAALDMGGLWVLYRTPLLAAAHDRPILHALVHAHVVAAGLLFTAAICQLDPVRRRWGLPLRGATLLAAGAAHAVLAKTLYALPPPGTAFAASDLHVAAQLMYYGGDLVEVALAVVLAVQWYAVAGRRRRARQVSA